MKLTRANSSLDVILSEAECDCIPNEFQCVKHGALAELSQLREGVEGIEELCLNERECRERGLSPTRMSGAQRIETAKLAARKLLEGWPK